MSSAFVCLFWGRRWEKLFQAESYVAKSEYRDRMKEFKSTEDFFQVLTSSGMLEPFCEKNGFDPEQAERILDSYASLETLIDQHNENFIQGEDGRRKRVSRSYP